MNPDKLPKPKNEQYEPNLEAQDEDVASGGNNRLTYLLGGVILALVVGYVALPKGHGEGIASVTPSFMLDDAAVTATFPAITDSLTASAEATPAKGTVLQNAQALKSTAKTGATDQKSIADAPANAAVAAAVTSGPVSAAPEPVATVAPEPAAPTYVTMSGKIDDENGQPLVGATVMLKGSNKAVSTDASGNYTLEVPSGTDNTLVYGYGGYDDEVVHARGIQPVNVTLTPREKAGRKRR